MGGILPYTQKSAIEGLMNLQTLSKTKIHGQRVFQVTCSPSMVSQSNCFLLAIHTEHVNMEKQDNRNDREELHLSLP